MQKSLRMASVLVGMILLCVTPLTAQRPNAPTTQRLAVPLAVKIHTVFGGKPLRFNTLALRSKAGNQFSISRLAFLLSKFRLIRADGSEVKIPDATAYLNPIEQRERFVLPAVPMGDYSGMAFRIGLDKSVNHADPSRFPVGHALNPLVNGLHWSWQGGYIFLALEGRYRQADGKIGGYSFHLANDGDPMQVTLRQNFSLSRSSEMTLKLDAAKLLSAKSVIDIHPENGGDSTHSAVGDELARNLKANATQAFSLEAVTPLPESNNTAKQTQTQSKRFVGTPVSFQVPAGFPQPKLPADNPLTREGIALGRALFFDQRLSGNNRQSCASCHQPKSAFSDAGKPFSKGIDGKFGTRNAMPLFNLAWRETFTWDGRRTQLRDQVLAPIQDKTEMHQTLPRTVAKLRADKNHLRQFAHAFGTPTVTAERLSLAIEQYLLTLVSADSKFDQARQSKAEFTDEEKQGLLLFITEYDPARGKRGADCFHCHGGNLFTDSRYTNNGLKPSPNDSGRMRVTRQSADKDKFLTPSLRNVALTAPYMHDGRFKTLEQVLDHYSSHVHRSETLDPNLAKHPETGIDLSPQDKKALLAFLRTLTDPQFGSLGR